MKFSLRQQVTIRVSGEQGEVIARAEYAVGGNNYLIRYQAGDGRAVESWWNEDALDAIDTPT